MGGIRVGGARTTKRVRCDLDRARVRRRSARDVDGAALGPRAVVGECAPGHGDRVRAKQGHGAADGGLIPGERVGADHRRLCRNRPRLVLSLDADRRAETRRIAVVRERAAGDRRRFPRIPEKPAGLPFIRVNVRPVRVKCVGVPAPASMIGVQGAIGVSTVPPPVAPSSVNGFAFVRSHSRRTSRRAAGVRHRMRERSSPSAGRRM